MLCLTSKSRDYTRPGLEKYHYFTALIIVNGSGQVIQVVPTKLILEIFWGKKTFTLHIFLYKLMVTRNILTSVKKEHGSK